MSAPGEADKLEDNTTLVNSEEGGMDKKSDWVDDWLDEDPEYDEGSSNDEADDTGSDIGSDEEGVFQFVNRNKVTRSGRNVSCPKKCMYD